MPNHDPPFPFLGGGTLLDFNHSLKADSNLKVPEDLYHTEFVSWHVDLPTLISDLKEEGQMSSGQMLSRQMLL